jgi:hypothetical protein
MLHTLIWPTSLPQTLDVSLARIIRTAFLCANLLLFRSGEKVESGLAAARKRQFDIIVGVWYPANRTRSPRNCLRLLSRRA